MPHADPPSARAPVATEDGMLVTTSADRRLAAAHWLMSTHPKPGHARREWTDHGIALLPLGTLFSAVRIPARLVHAAAGSEDPATVDAHLTEALLEGPVICDPRGRHYYALVPASTAVRWSHPLVECLGRDSYLGVPRLDAVELHPQAWASYWSVPMSSAAELCSPEAVAQLVVLGSFQGAEEGPE